MAGAGIVSDSFDLEALQRFASSYRPNSEFIYWVRSSERVIVNELEELMNPQSIITFPEFSKYVSI